MHCYVAIASRRVHLGGFADCVQWAQRLIADRKAQVVKIAKLRPGESQHATIVCDVDREGVWPARSGRVVDVSKIRKWHRDGQEKT
jgi:hypothetical protein